LSTAAIDIPISSCQPSPFGSVSTPPELLPDVEPELLTEAVPEPPAAGLPELLDDAEAVLVGDPEVEEEEEA
jgi:hypothetical protein